MLIFRQKSFYPSLENRKTQQPVLPYPAFWSAGLLLLAVGTLSCWISEISVLFLKILVIRNQNFPSEIISIYRWEGIVFWNNASSLLMSNFNARRLLMNWNEFQWRKLNKGPSINYVTKKDHKPLTQSFLVT